LIAFVALASTLAVGNIVHSPSKAAALEGSQFHAGLIITDDLFYDRAAMTSAQIQAFLDANIRTCANANCLNIANVTIANQARRVSADTGNTVCEAITGGTMRVSELIYRVQVACSISAKVILVTLQKEQGLVTDRSPSDGALRAAMGMACPDTAPCDTAFAGLATQIIRGAGQLMTYKAGEFARQPGNHFIPYNPNSSCGGTTVYIQNYATAALYNYTPYQPNTAALANLGGIGNNCSSYGNRNFWVFYNNWFGSPISGVGPGAKAIDQAWAEAGGVNGAWGNRLTWMPCNVGVTCGHLFENVYAGWTLDQGVNLAVGRMKDWVVSQGIAVIGSPNSIEVPVTKNGGGIAQSFTNGLVNWGPDGAFLLSGGIRSEHGRLGGVGGATGWPTSKMSCDSAGYCTQSFQHAVIGALPNGTGVSVADAGVLAYYLERGGATGALGAPQSQPTTVSQNGGGTQQAFQGGLVNKSSKGIFTITKLFRAAQAAAGGVTGAIGWPTGEQVCSGNVCSQTFQHALFLSRGNEVRTLADPELLAYFEARGGVAGSLGYPLTDKLVVASSPNGAGWQMAFDNGLVESSAAGTFTLTEPVRSAHGASGGVAGALGWPTEEFVCSNGSCGQLFQHGMIWAEANWSVRVIASTAITNYFQSAGGASGALGYPLTDTLPVASSSPNGGGVQVAFRNGLVESSAAGTFTVKDAIRSAHGAAGGVGGSLGWPTAEQSCSGGACSQEFQGGSIQVSAQGKVRIVHKVADPAIAAYYASSGGASGPLGYPLTGSLPVASSSPNGGGVQVAFEHGLVESSAAGTFTVKDAIRSAHGAAGGVAGPYGWPTAEQNCTTTSCSQAFQNGTITVNR
jgi:uncharacterized protein with LGFP repeats